jgi:putative esterase
VAGIFSGAASHSVSRVRWATRLVAFLALVISLAGAMTQQASAATASDNFNRANGNLTGTWTSISDGGLKITSQTVAGSVSGGSSGATWNAATFTSDQFSQVEVTSTQLTGGQWIGPAVRTQNGGQNTYLGIYFWNSGSPQLRIYKRISGTWIQLGSSYSSGALTAGTQLLLQASGSKITFAQNGVTRISVTDTSLTGGAPGIMAYGTGRADNWAGGDLSAPATFTVGGSVSGLSGTLVLQDNGADNLTLTANGPFTFATGLAAGAAYAVTVKTQPAGQTCTVTNGSGTMGSANVTNVAVSCSANPTFTVGGTVSGLTGTVVLQDNGADNLTVTANGPFTFATALASGAAYAVTVKTNPTGQACAVTNGSGTMGSANVTNVTVTCSNSSGTTGTDDFNRANGALGPNWTGISDGALTITSQTVAGTASGGTTGDIRTAETYGSNQSSQVEVTSTQLTGGQWIGPAVRMQNGGQSTYLGIYFWNNGSPQLRLYKRISGSYIQLGSSFSSGALPAGTQLQLQASGSSITFLQNGVSRISVTDTSLTGGAPGVMAFGTGRGDNWAGATLAAGPTYTVGGTLSGLSGGTLILQDNGGDNLNLTANGSFTFATGLPAGTGYSVTVSSSPAGQTCAVTNGSGTIGSANVTNVTVTCTTSSTTFSVVYQGTDANGVASYATVSAANGNTTEVMRVLAPTSPAAGVPHNFLFVLPVEANNGDTFGDGIDVMRQLNAQNQYNLTIIEPSFALEPWFADNPVNSSAQQETFMTQQLVPWVQANLGTTGQEQNWLIGFSKSGIGAEDLILKHPGLFTLAAAWDWPADMSSYDEYGSSSANSYGTDANFQASYRLTTAFLNAHKAPFTSANRLWIGGWNAFQTDMSDYDTLLTSLGIAHSTETPTLMPHAWDSGWVPLALAALSQDSGNLPNSVTASIQRPAVPRNARP